MLWSSHTALKVYELTGIVLPGALIDKWSNGTTRSLPSPLIGATTVFTSGGTASLVVTLATCPTFTSRTSSSPARIISASDNGPPLRLTRVTLVVMKTQPKSNEALRLRVFVSPTTTVTEECAQTLSGSTPGIFGRMDTLVVWTQPPTVLVIRGRTF